MVFSVFFTFFNVSKIFFERFYIYGFLDRPASTAAKATRVIANINAQ